MMSVIGPVQSHYHESSPVGKRNLRWEGFVVKVGFEPGVKEWRSDGWWEWGWWERYGLTSGWGGESRQEWWGWWNESENWFQRRGDTYLNERSVIFKEEMVGGRERVITDEERVLRGGWKKIRLWRQLGWVVGCKNFVGERQKFIFVRWPLASGEIWEWEWYEWI